MGDKDTPPPPPDGATAVVPRQLYYLAIDGTRAMDSAVYGELLEARGWRNLVSEFLQPHPDDKTRLHDPGHPYLPICLFDGPRRSKKIGVVCPNGRDGKGLDSFWRAYAGESPDEAPSAVRQWKVPDRKPYETSGRHTASEKCTRVTSLLMQFPEIETRTHDGAVKAQLTGGLITDPWEEGERRTFQADLMLVSSHGWLGGFMRGDEIQAWADAQPEKARQEYHPALPFFVLGEAAERGWGFHGPTWIILAQCSTANSATWPLWARVLGNSQPGVRGILAYEEVSPGPEGSITIARTFFEAAKTKTMLEAWKEANKGEKWAAIVHEEALQDRLGQWRDFKPLSSIATTSTKAAYRGFLKSISGGEPIKDLPAPFEIHLARKLPDTPFPDYGPDDLPWGEEMPIVPSTLHMARARLGGSKKSPFFFTVHAPVGTKFKAARIRWIHIRTSYKKQLRAAQLWEEIELVGLNAAEARLDTSDPDRITVIATGTPVASTRMSLVCHAASKLEAAGLEGNHSYLWPLVSLELENGNAEYAFKTTGVRY